MLLAFCTVLNMLFDFFGVECSFLSLVGGISFLPLIFLYLSSIVFRFCIYHRLFLDYIVACNLVNCVDYYIGIPFSNAGLFMFHIILIGLFLFLILYFYRREKCCKR